MDYIVRKPDFVVKIVRPNYESSTYVAQTIVEFISSENISATYHRKKYVSSTDLIAYNFNESLDSLNASFSLSLTLAQDELNQTWYDKILEMDLVFISEFGESRFAGYVQRRRYTAKVSSDGKPQRSINISGGSLGVLLSSFKLIIDQFLYQGTPTAITASGKLAAALAQQMGVGAQIAPIFETLYESFFTLVLKMGTVNDAGGGIKTVLDEFIDYESQLSRDLVINYPLNLSLYQVGANSIWELWNQMVHPPFGELFGLWNDGKKKYQIIFRQAPFDRTDWALLTINNIPSIIITDFDIGTSIDEIYTFFYCTLPGSGYDRNTALAVGVDGRYGFTPVSDDVKWKKYGYNPLIVELRYFNREKMKEFTGAGTLITDFSKQLKEWFTNNDEFLSGTLNIMTIDESESRWKGKLKNPRVGEKIRFIDAEFYVEESQHSWNYGGPMRTSLNVTRGYVYNNGVMLRKVENLGAKARTITEKVMG